MQAVVERRLIEHHYTCCTQWSDRQKDRQTDRQTVSSIHRLNELARKVPVPHESTDAVRCTKWTASAVAGGAAREICKGGEGTVL